MKDAAKTKEQLINELVELRQRIAEFEESEIECKRPAGALRENEEKYRQLAESLPDVVYEFDLEGKLIYVNETVTRVFGYSKDEALSGIRVEDIIAEEDQIIASKAIDEVSRGKTIRGERTFIRKDGTRFIGDIHSGPIYKDKDVIGVRGVLRDITDFKRALEALQESEIKYRTLFENANDAIFIADTKTGVILDANRQAEQLIGRPREEIIGMDQAKLHPPSHEEYYKEKFREHVQEGRVFDLEAEVIKKDGSTVAVFISASVISLQGKEVIQGIFTDITKEKTILDLRKEIADRKLVEKAKGVLMDRHEISEKEAMRRLQRESRRQRKKIKEIARGVISSETILD